MASYKVKRSDELYHYGIKGQKWGVRRFENLDGTLTPEGKKRYSYESQKYTAEGVADLKKSYDRYVNRPKTHTYREKHWTRKEKREDTEATKQYGNALKQLYSAIKAKDPEFQKALGDATSLNTKMDLLYQKHYDNYFKEHPYETDSHPAERHALEMIRKSNPKLEDKVFKAELKLQKHLENGVKNMCGEEFFNTPIKEESPEWTYGKQFCDMFNGPLWEYTWMDAHVSDGWQPRS